MDFMLPSFGMLQTNSMHIQTYSNLLNSNYRSKYQALNRELQKVLNVSCFNVGVFQCFQWAFICSHLARLGPPPCFYWMALLRSAGEAVDGWILQT